MTLSLWPLPLLAALLPLTAAVLAWQLSLAAGTVPDCNPFVDGCASISRAGRHGLANLVFRGLVLPAAVLQALVWLLAPGWLRSLGGSGGRTLPWIGLVAGACLVLYGSFLGSEGEAYRFLRRYGTALYFGGSCIAMLVLARRLEALRPRSFPRHVVAVVCLLPLLGLAHVLLPLAWPERQDALQNVTEWWGGAIFTAFFASLAWAWWRTAFRCDLRGGVPMPD